MGKREVSVLITGLNYTTPDSLVREYLGKHGKVISDKVIYEKEKSGDLAGFLNGNRRYLVDFSYGRNLGSYHIIDGFKVFVTYAGQQKTCWRCHKTSRDCPGGGMAKKCEDRMGPRVSLIDHMRNHWEDIGFNPNRFELDINELNDAGTEDMEIKENSSFTPPKREIPKEASVIYTGVNIRNIPLTLTDEEVVQFLVTEGIPTGHKAVKIQRNKRNISVDVENLISDECDEIIKNMNEVKFGDKKVYCNGIVYLQTPAKETEISKEETGKHENVNSAENSQPEKSPEKTPLIPGLLPKEIKKAKKKADKRLVKQKKRQQKEEENVEKHKHTAKYFMKNDIQQKESAVDGDDEEDSETDSEDELPTEDSEEHNFLTPTLTQGGLSHEGFFQDLEKDKEEQLTPRRFSSSFAKQLEREDLLKVSIHNQNTKRSRSSPGDQQTNKMSKKESGLPRLLKEQ